METGSTLGFNSQESALCPPNQGSMPSWQWMSDKHLFYLETSYIGSIERTPQWRTLAKWHKSKRQVKGNLFLFGRWAHSPYGERKFGVICSVPKELTGNNPYKRDVGLTKRSNCRPTNKASNEVSNLTIKWRYVLSGHEMKRHLIEWMQVLVWIHTAK